VDRVAAAFAAASGRAALMPYLMAGFPDLDGSVAIAEACADAGADLVELGVPFSDPLADGPVIHAAGTRALAAGATLAGVLEAARRIAERVPVVLMCYANPLLARGTERVVGELAAAGASGLIVPDLPLEEADAVRSACDAAGLALVPLVAPTTPDDRMAAIAGGARGFLYTVAVTGTTGERGAADASPAAVLARAKAHSPVPVALGFGIGSPERMTGTLERRCAIRAQSQVVPVPPRVPRLAVSSRCRSVWKRSASRMSAAEATRSALMTRAPVRWATAVQNDGPSSPCSCTCVRPMPSTACATSSRPALTNTPTSCTRRRSARAMPAATAGSHARAEPGQRMKPIAHASSDAASSASSTRVMPHTFTRAMRAS
jgi:tryptophan synthase alpha chain